MPDQDSETQYREYLQKGIDSQWAGEEIKAGFQKILGWLDSQETDESHPLFFGTISYGATGEGETYQFFASREKNEGDFIRYCIEKSNWYYAVGLDISTDIGKLPPHIVKLLLTEEHRRFLELEASAHEQGRLTGHIEVFLSHHANYS